MNTNATHGDEIFEILLRDALIDKYKNEVKDVYSYSSEYTGSGGFDRKITAVGRGMSRTQGLKTAFRVFKKAAVVTASVMGVAFGGLMTQDEVSAAVQSVIRTPFERYDQYEYTDSNNELTVDNFNDNIKLGYVPDGYRLSSIDYMYSGVSLYYTDNDGNEIILDYFIADDGLSSIYDNEHNTYDSFIENGTEYHYYESNDENFYDMLVWYKDGYAFDILAHLPKDELVKIAENLKNLE